MIEAVADNTQITDESNYLTYTVTKNGTYRFKATNEEGKTVETLVKVNNIEKFSPIEEVATVTIDDKAYRYKGAAVPKGYFVNTESKLDTGFVITDSIDEQGYSTGNEWVWVPVNEEIGNDDYYITLAQAETVYGTSVSYTKYSKLYSFVGKTREDYGTFHPYAGYTGGKLGKPSVATGSMEYREPAILTNTSSGDVKYYNTINKRGTTNKFTNVTDLAQQYVTDYENIIGSIDKYGGFYVGRYEITKEGSNRATEKPGTALTGGNYTWYTLYNECMTFGKENTESSMMYGTNYDQIMQWLAISGYDVGYTGETKTGYGNHYYEDVVVKDKNTMIIVKENNVEQKLETGQTSYTKSNNIFDLSGNCNEWTQEASNTLYRIRRGGGYYRSVGVANQVMTSVRLTYTPAYAGASFSTRPMLYII